MKTIVTFLIAIIFMSCSTGLKVTSKTDNNIEVKTFKSHGVTQSYIIIKKTNKDIAKK